MPTRVRQKRSSSARNILIDLYSKSGSTVKPRASARFLRNWLEGCKSGFDSLCTQGCSPPALCDMVFAISTLWVHNSSRKNRPQNIAGMNEAQRRHITRDLETLAARVERLKDVCLQQLQALSVPAPLNAQQRALVAFSQFSLSPRHSVNIYRSLPALMRDFAADIRSLCALQQEIMRKYDLKELLLLELLEYVRASTGKPNYTALAHILSGAFDVALSHHGSSNSHPRPSRVPARLTSPDALRKLYDRTPPHLALLVFAHAVADRG
jgi:hypothetical protein